MKNYGITEIKLDGQGYLNKIYNNKLVLDLSDNSEDLRDKWLTYKQIIGELINSGNDTYANELKYRMTGDEDVNEVIIDIYNKIDEPTTHLTFLLGFIETYIEDDLIKRFTN
jgi:hypothetical protein